MTKQARAKVSNEQFYVDRGRIFDRGWTKPGYIIKVWAIKSDDSCLVDYGQEVEAEAQRLCSLLNYAISKASQ